MSTGIDFETYCELNIKDVGLDRYVNHPTFQVLLCSVSSPEGTSTFDFVLADFDDQKSELLQRLEYAIYSGSTLFAHNSQFEIAVLHRLYNRWFEIYDSAAIARSWGGSSSLERCAPQLLGVQKLGDEGRLVRKFCTKELPQADDLQLGGKDADDWREFKRYCERDAQLGRMFGEEYRLNYQDFQLTQKMNTIGWFVDTGALERMIARRDANKERALSEFRAKHDPAGEFNVNSLKQCKEFCGKHGIRASSFAEDKMLKMKKVIEGKNEPRYQPVLDLLDTKLTLGGSSLNKLDVIQRMVGSGDRLRYQYMHWGAGQTHRTSGVGVQMQNLKRLHNIRDLSELWDEDSEWNNDELAENIRQLFMAEHPQGLLFVGDFSSVESRGLAYLAGEEWKLDAYRKGKDLYKVLADRKYQVGYDNITKDQRQFGKVGELSCGYQAAKGAVKDFAEAMHVILTEEEAAEIVTDWRAANPAIVELWATLDQMLHDALDNGRTDTVQIGNQMLVHMEAVPEVQSVQSLHPGAKQITILVTRAGTVFRFRRVLRGVYRRGRDLVIHKPVSARTQKLWTDEFTDPKTGVIRKHTIYGGKLAGILTQSFCREIFFMALHVLSTSLEGFDNVKLIGQFHDEIVVEWQPEHTVPDADPWNTLTEMEVMEKMKWIMSNPQMLTGFPLAAEINFAHRYIK